MDCKKNLSSSDDKKMIINKFKNILQETSTNSFLWATRFISFVRAYRNNSQPSYSPDEIKEIMLKNDEMYNLLKEVPRSQIKEIIDEMASSFSLPVVRWLGYILVKMLSSTLSNLYVNETALLQIKRNMGWNPVFFLPTHRSYADFILMALICFHYGIQLPYVAAGMDFHSMKIMGEILRRCKAFFIRRKFSNDKIYRTIFEIYFQLLINLGESPIEFFIEGTRSRTSKSLAPKFGMLSIAVETYVKGKVPDITLVPVCISYDRILEEKLFAFELMGIPKPKESTMHMFKAFRSLDGKYGNVHFNFGKPIQAREWINQNFSKSINAGKDVSIPDITNRLAHCIIQKQIDLQILVAFNVLSILISFKISKAGTYTIPMLEAVQEFKFLCELIKNRNGTLHIGGNVPDAILSSCVIHSSLVYVVNDDIVFRRTLKSNPDGCSANGTYETKLNEVIPLVMLQLYINPAMHLFVPPALVLLALNPAKSFYKGNVYEAFRFISDVMKTEFVLLCSNSCQDIYDEALNFLIENKCVSENGLELGSNVKTNNYLLHLIQPFVFGYGLLAKTLLHKAPLENNGWTEKMLLDCCEKTAESALELGLLHPYSVTKDLLKNALYAFVNLNYIKKYSKEQAVYFTPIHEALHHFIKYIGVMRSSSGQALPKCRV